MKRVKITVLNPPITTRQQEWFATSWRLGKAFDLNESKNVVFKKDKDTTNVKSIVVTGVDLSGTDNIYVQSKYHYRTPDGSESESDWSRVTLVQGDQVGYKMSEEYIATPIVYINDQDSQIELSTSDYFNLSNKNNHGSTDYQVLTGDNEEIFVRKDDEDNLTNIFIPNKYKDGKVYQFTARHKSITNNYSLYGKELYINRQSSFKLYDVYTSGQLVTNRKFYYRIDIKIKNVISYDLEFVDQEGKVIITKSKSKKLIDVLEIGDLTLGMIYTVRVRFNLDNGYITSWEDAFVSTAIKNTYLIKNPNIEYLNMLTVGNEYNTAGLNCVTATETYNNNIIATDFKSNKLSLYSVLSGGIREIKTLYRFDSNVDIDYVNVIQLQNTYILADVVEYTNEKQVGPCFYLFDYNPLSATLTLKSKLYRSEEKYNTAICNSIAPIEDLVYYIPAQQYNGDLMVNLQLHILDTTTMRIVEQIGLPFEAVRNVSLFRDHNGMIYICGGSNRTKFEDETFNVEYWNRDNNRIFKFDPSTKKFEYVGSFSEAVPRSVYALQCFLRLDGKIVMFNGCHSGPGLKYKDIVLFDIASGKVTTIPVTNRWDIPFRSNFVFRNGNILRISSREHDPQLSYLYISNTVDKKHVNPPNNIVEENVVLVVKDGEVVNIEDPYKYKSITVEGTGIVRWYRPQGIVEITSDDYIATRDITLQGKEFYKNKYRNIIVLDGIKFRIEE